ncbi:MAG: ABC transporter ATP-binding protein [Proteobacteria bacterium]|nr:ABC transporter ATP-binding protein [Pseudomonadota bacterium]
MLAARDLGLGGRLDGVSAVLRPGEVTAICGPNGAGKSSLLACLAGLLAPDSGTVLMGDAPLVAMPARQRAQAIGYLPQAGDVAWDVSVEVLVALGRLPWGGVGGGGAVDRAIATMELEGLRHRPVSHLSGGERARALIARVLAGDPCWILADEPLASLDLGHALALLHLLKVEARAGRGVVLVLHDLAMAMNSADRVLVLDGGRLVADGPPAEALTETVIERVWGVRARWLGEAGARALTLPA